MAFSGECYIQQAKRILRTKKMLDLYENIICVETNNLQ